MAVSAPPCPPGDEFELHFIGELELPGGSIYRLHEGAASRQGRF